MRTSKIKANLRLSATAVGIAMLSISATSAQAQELIEAQTPEETTNQGSAKDFEIVVTARKREESVKDVPLTVNALTNAQLEARSVRSLVDLTRYTPGMNFNLGTSRATSAISVRGMTQISAVGDNRRDLVSVFIDGVPYVGTPAGIGLEGIERVEVIKGPQSALFGRATFGGAISIITQTPGNELTARVSATAATYEDLRLSAIIEVPIVRDLLSVAVAGEVSRFGGFYQNSEGGRLGRSNRNLGVATLSLTPTSNLKFKARYSKRYDEDGEAASTLIARFPEHNCGPFPGFQNRSLAGLPASITTVGEARRAYCGPLRTPTGPIGINIATPAQSVGRVPFTEHELKLRHEMGTLSGNWDFAGGFGLVGTVSRQRSQFQILADFERAPEDRYQIYSNNVQRQDFYEGRLTSPAGKWISAMIGASRVDQDFDTSGGFIFGSLFGAAAGGPAAIVLDRNRQENDAVFGSVSVDPFAGLTLIGEGRYQKETLTSGVGTANSFSVSTTAFLPRLTARYRLSNETTAYFNYAQGNQPSAGYAPLFLLSPAGQAIAEAAGVFGVLPEAKLENYEVGLKHYAADGRWFVNLATFYNAWTGRQGVRTVQVDIDRNGIINLTGTGAAREVFNAVPFAAGDSNTRGIEVEAGWRPVQSLVLGGNVAWAKTNITKSLNDALLLRFFGRTDAAGQKFPLVPEYSGSAYAEYTGTLSATSQWFVRGDVTYLGKIFDSSLNFAYVPEQWRLNLRGGFRWGRAEVTLFVNNALNSKVLESARYNSDSAADPFFFQLAASEASLPGKRQFGVTVSSRF